MEGVWPYLLRLTAALSGGMPNLPERRQIACERIVLSAFADALNTVFRVFRWFNVAQRPSEGLAWERRFSRGG
jgi:hypothetical protein